MMEWLKQQPEPGTESETDTSALILLETLNIKHLMLESPLNFLLTTFAMPHQSGSVAIASTRPSLSVIYPGTDKFPLILSKDDHCTSALFIAISDQEYLAAASVNQIILWNLATNTSNVVC